MNVDLLDDDTNISDLKQILTTSRSFKQAAGVRNRLLGVSHEGVFPVSVSLVVTISSTTQELTLDSVPLVPEITLDRGIILSRTRVKKANLKKATCYMAISLVINNYVDHH